MDPDQNLAALARAAASVKRAESSLDASIITAREAGLSWAQIGVTLGMSRQSAHERWGHMARGGCQRRDCDCPSHEAGRCPCGHGPGRGRSGG